MGRGKKAKRKKEEERKKLFKICMAEEIRETGVMMFFFIFYFIFLGEEGAMDGGCKTHNLL